MQTKCRLVPSTLIARATVSILFIFLSQLLPAQPCTTNSGIGCQCSDSLKTDCDLLPDFVVSEEALSDSGAVIEYPQHNSIPYYPNISDDGKLRLTVIVPNIGYGPFELFAINYFVCGYDTLVGNPGICPDGSIPKGLISQNIYHKIQDSMTYYSRIAEATEYHPLNSNFQVDDYCEYTIRIKNNNQPNPLKWSVVSRKIKHAYCLQDAGNCSGSPGYCKDDNGNTLLDSNFVNFGVGGYFTCSPKQGISPGYFDVYSADDWGMWIDIPPGTCNGNYFLVIHVDPFNHFIESNENNNVMAIPLALTKQIAPGNPTANITPNGYTTFCQGDSLLLTTNGGHSYLWSTGDTTQSITVKQAGTYSVTVNSPCGTANSPPLSISVLPPPPLAVVTNDSICKADTAYLKASGTDSLFWYKDMFTNYKLGTGTVFKTPSLSQSTTYYAENVKRVPGMAYTVGLTDTTGGGQYYSAYTYVVFDCVSSFVLNAVTMYARDTGTITIKLRDHSGYPIFFKAIHLAKGKNRVLLDLPIYKNNDYLLSVEGDSILYGNNANVNYPYTVMGVVSIKTTTKGNDTYLYFYNWEIKTFDLMCSSGRVPVTAHVKNNCSVGVNAYNTNPLHVTIHPNPFSELSTITLEGCKQGLSYLICVYDVFGKAVMNKILRPDNNSSQATFILNRDNFSNGIYFYKILSVENSQASQFLYAGKLMIE